MSLFIYIIKYFLFIWIHIERAWCENWIFLFMYSTMQFLSFVFLFCGRDPQRRCRTSCRHRRQATPLTAAGSYSPAELLHAAQLLQVVAAEAPWCPPLAGGWLRRRVGHLPRRCYYLLIRGASSAQAGSFGGCGDAAMAGVLPSDVCSNANSGRIVFL